LLYQRQHVIGVLILLIFFGPRRAGSQRRRKGSWRAI